MNDYNVEKAASTNVVDIIWFGHPGDSLRDICTRQLTVKWCENSALSEHPHSVAMEDEKIVLCWEYFCCGSCYVITKAEESVQSEASGNDDPDIADDGSSDAEQSEPRRRK
jgi:hypothetical protein